MRFLVASGVLLSTVAGLAGCSGGGVTNTPIVPTPIPVPVTLTAKPKFAYTANQSGSISGYSVNTVTGALTSLSNLPSGTGVGATVVAHDPQNRFLIVGSRTANTLMVFNIDNTTGALTANAAYATVSQPVSIVVNPAGTLVFVASQGTAQIGEYALSSTGGLTPVSGSPFSTGATGGATTTCAACLAMDSSGSYLLVQDSANIYTFYLDRSTSQLLLHATTPQPGSALLLDPERVYLYSINPVANSITAFTFDQNTGALAQHKSSPASGTGAVTMAVSPTGSYAYTIETNNMLYAYSISNGVFTPVGTPYAGIYGQQIAVDPSGSFVYVPQACTSCGNSPVNVVSQFAIGTTGALTPLSPPTVSTGVTPWGITVTSQ